MKKFKFIAAALLCAALSISCNKDNTAGFGGSYTYKISGTVTLMAKDLVGLDAQTLAAYKQMGVKVDPVTVALNPEQGQMHILEGDDDALVVTFNNILGNADVTTATVTGGTILLSGKDTKTAQVTDGVNTLGGGIVLFGGEGRCYDDMLILNLTYQGGFSIGDVEMVVTGSDVKCVAQKN